MPETYEKVERERDALACEVQGLRKALEAIVLKLERKESASGAGDDCEWAKIDRNDATIDAARAVLAKGGE